MTSPNHNVAPVSRVCKKGHALLVGKSQCQECNRLRHERYRESNREEIRKRHKQWVKDHREAVLAKQKQYYFENVDENRASRRKWKKDHPEVCEQHRHNHTQRNPEYRVWIAMRRRCQVESDSGFSNCGAKGITVCEQWLGKNGYANFVADVGPRPSRLHTMQRINECLGYSPDNCKWATKKEESRGTIRNRLYTYAGKTLCLKDWAEETGISWSTLYNRVVWAKWNLSEALNKEPHSVDRSAHEELVRIAIKWLRDTEKCSIVLSEMASMAMERPDAIGWKATVTKSVLIECKSNMVDFIGDAKKPFRSHPQMGMGFLRYYMVPDDMVRPEDVPANWGLLYAGERVRVIKKATPFLQWNKESESAMLISSLRRTQLRIDQPLHEWLKWDSANSPIRPTIIPE